MLQSKDAIAEVIEVVTAADFYDPDHRAVFDAILGLYSNGKLVDADTVATALGKADNSRRATATSLVQTLAGVVTSPANAGYYAEVVASKASRRRLIQVGSELVELGYDSADEDVEAAIKKAASEIAGLMSREHVYDGAVPLSDVMGQVLDDLEQIASAPPQAVFGIPTGFRDLDALTNGLSPGELIVIAGRPSVGKSILASDLARSCSIKHGLPAAFFTLESNRDETIYRMMSAEARVALHHMRNGLMTDDDWARMARRMTAVSEAPIFIDDRPNLTFTHIAKECRRLRETQDLHLVIVDSVNGLPYGTRPFDNRYLEISEIARCLKQLAKELRIPIVATSQLNRSVEARIDRRPILSDLRDSGTLEENADVVVLLHREDLYERESSRAGEADLIVAKNRHGLTANITTAFQGHYARFVDMAAS